MKCYGATSEEVMVIWGVAVAYRVDVVLRIIEILDVIS